jgi:anaerobic selenocysteine-containing dehydrogenase
MSSKRSRDIRIGSYRGPVGGWGSAIDVAKILLREAVPLKGALALWRQNKPRGFACVSCSYGRAPHLGLFEFCENGAKATAWEITDRRCPPAFFAEHTLAELEGWSDLELEEVGRLTEPMRWDSGSDKYVPISWAEAFADIGAKVRELAPESSCSTPPAALRSKPLTCISFWPACTATTTCQTAPTCVTRAPPWHCRRRLAWPSER